MLTPILRTIIYSSRSINSTLSMAICILSVLPARSNAQAITWEVPLPHSAFFAQEFQRTPSGRIYLNPFAAFATLLYTETEADIWTNTGVIANNHFFIADDESIYTPAGGGLHRFDPTDNSVVELHGDQAQAVVVFGDNDENIVLALFGIPRGSIVVSRDGGATWTTTYDKIAFSPLGMIRRSDGAIIVGDYPGSNGTQKSLISTDDGLTWTPKQYPGAFIKAVPVGSGRQFWLFAGAEQVLYHTDDDGETLVPASVDIQSDFAFSVDYDEFSKKIVAFTRYKIWVSADNGDSFDTLIADLPEGGINSGILTKSNRLLIQAGNKIYRTVDPVFAAADTFATPVEYPPKAIPDQEDLTEMSIFPNPGNGIFSVQVHAPMPGSGVLLVYDMTGKLVFEQHQLQTSGAFQEITLDLTGIAQGAYVVELKVATIVRRGMLIVSR